MKASKMNDNFSQAWPRPDINHLEGRKWLDRTQAAAARKMAGSTKLLSSATLSDYVHNLDLHPSPSDVTSLWKNLAVYLAAVHDH